MSLLRAPPGAFPTADPSGLHPDELALAFRRWADGHAHPDSVHVGHGEFPMTELIRLLGDSHDPLATSTAIGLGLRPGATIASAASALLWATVDPHGPRCRSFRAATFFLRGLAQLDADVDAGAASERELL
jgi:hypothetical protein